LISENTLFVLGAGASNPYGLPLGSELRTLICDLGNGNNLAHTLSEAGVYSLDDIQKFSQTFRRSNVSSIDEFLSRLPHFVDIGKALIGAILCLNEDPNKISSEETQDHWFRLLWNVLIDKTHVGEDLIRNKVRFITFNYDRSLEFSLHEATKETYDLSNKGSFQIWSQFQIMHVYGCIGGTNFGDAYNIRPYSIQNSPAQLIQAGNGINIIPEGRDNAKIFEEARDWFDWAKHVFILGFGFDRLNCERLGFSSVIDYRNRNSQPLPEIHASVFGLTGKERDVAKECLIGSNCSWTTHYEMNLKTLRHAGLPRKLTNTTPQSSASLIGSGAPIINQKH